MKRVIIALVMLLLAVIIASICSVTLDNNVKSVLSDVQNLQKNLNKIESQQVINLSEAIFKKWLKTEKILKLTTVQGKIAPITEKFYHLSNLYNGDIKELSKNLKEIKVMLEIFLSSEKTVLINIF